MDGGVHRVNGLLPMILAARAEGLNGIIIPQENSEEAQIVPEGIDIIPVCSLQQAVEFLAGMEVATPMTATALPKSSCLYAGRD